MRWKYGDVMLYNASKRDYICTLLNNTALINCCTRWVKVRVRVWVSNNLKMIRGNVLKVCTCVDIV